MTVLQFGLLGLTQRKLILIETVPELGNQLMAFLRRQANVQIHFRI